MATAERQATAQRQDFFNPSSMVTPGAAGVLMMFIVNGLVYQFPELSPRFTALVISFLIAGGVALYAKQPSSPGLKAVYWVLNSLIVFVMGFGSNNLTAEAARSKQAWLPPVIALAHAQPEPKAAKPAPAKA